MSKQVFFDSASAWLYLVFRRGWGCDELALLRNKTHACRFLQVLCHAIVNLLPGGESSQVQEQHQVRIYTMIKQYPLHRIYVTSFVPPSPPPSSFVEPQCFCHLWRFQVLVARVTWSMLRPITLWARFLEIWLSLRTCTSSLQNTVEPLLRDTVTITQNVPLGNT